MQKYFNKIVSIIIVFTFLCQSNIYAEETAGLCLPSNLAPSYQPQSFAAIAHEMALGGVLVSALARHAVHDMRSLSQRWPQVSGVIGAEFPQDDEFKIGIFDNCVYIIRGKYLVRYAADRNTKDDLYVTALEKHEQNPGVKKFDEQLSLGGKNLVVQVFDITPEIEAYITRIVKFLPGNLSEIKEAKKGTDLDLDRVREKGALVFDIDGTLLENKQRNLDNEPGVLNTLLDLLEGGFRVAIISGNSRPEQAKRIIEPIRKKLKERGNIRNIINLIVYVNGGAIKITFNNKGDEVLDKGYSKDKGIEAEDIDIIKSVLSRMLRNKLGLTEGELEAWSEWFALREDFPNVTFGLPWINDEAEVDIPVISAEDMADVMLGEKRPLNISSPWIETRDGAQLSIKLFPKTPRDIRAEVIREIELELERRGRGGRLVLRNAGFASIDVNRTGIDKSVAVLDLLDYWRIEDRGAIAYFGDEFSGRGNDLPVLNVEGIKVFSVTKGETGADPVVRDKVKWVGAGPEATKKFLNENLRGSDTRKALAVLGFSAGENIEDTLWGTAGEKSRFRTAIEGFMGVKDLVIDQRIPEKRDEAEIRAKKVLMQAAIKLAKELKKPLDSITQDEFNSVLGVSQVVVAGGLAQRYSPILHKAVGTPELSGDTNMRLAIWGSYKSPGSHPVISISNRLITWLLKDEYVEELVNSGKEIEAFMIELLARMGQKPVVINGVIQKGIIMPDALIDLDKKALFFTADAVVVYFHHYGFGDAFAESLITLKEAGLLNKTMYKQYVFSEMAEAGLPEKSYASFITYLDAVANDSLIAMGAKEADPKKNAKDILTKTGNLFLEEGQLIAYTDAPDMPQYRKKKLIGVLEKLARWDSLTPEEKQEIQKQFAVTDDGKILISANCGIFRNDIMDYFNEFFHYDDSGCKPGFIKVDIDESGGKTEKHQIDPKKGEPFYTAPDLVETVSREWQRLGNNRNDIPVRFVNTGKAPSSIKDMKGQMDFNRKWHAYIMHMFGFEKGVFFGPRADRNSSELFYNAYYYLCLNPEDTALLEKRREIIRGQLLYTVILESKNCKDLREIMRVDSAGLKRIIEDTAKSLGMSPIQLVLGILGDESYYSLGLDEVRNRPLRAPPHVVSLTGGTAIGAFLINALREAGFKTDDDGILLAALLPTLDDGGSTYDIVRSLNKRGYGVLPPMGDQANVLLTGLASLDKVKYVLGDSGRVRDDLLERLKAQSKEATLENIVIMLLENSYKDTEITKSADFLYFASNILSAARLIDDNFIKKRILGLKDASIRNLFVVALLYEYGLLISDKKEGMPAVDNGDKSGRYNEALLSLSQIAGVRDGLAGPVSFEPATLYARYEDNMLIWKEDIDGRKTDRVILIRPSSDGIRVQFRKIGVKIDKVLSDNGNVIINTGKNVIKITNKDGKPLITVLSSERAERVEIEGAEWLLQETGDEAFLVNFKNEDEKYTLANDGSGRGRRQDESEYHPLNISGLELYLRPRLIVMQTNITETANFSKVTEIGLLDNFQKGKPSRGKKLTVNKDAVRFIEEAQDMIIIGPGSIFTSILPHFMIPEIVSALETANASGKCVVWIMNGTIDNETAGLTVSDIIRFMEQVSGKKVEEIFTDIIFTSFNEQEADIKLKRTLFQKAVVEIREPCTASREAKKSRGPLVPTQDEMQELKKRGIEVHQDNLLTVKESHDRITGRRSFKVTQDPAKVGRILKDIKPRVMLSHEIREKWEVISFDAEKKHLEARIEYFWHGELIGEVYLDLDPMAASINTCNLKYFRNRTRMIKEILVRTFLGASYLSKYLDWNTKWAHTYYTLSDNEEREGEYWPPEKWQWELNGNPKAVEIRKLGFVDGKFDGKGYLSGADGKRYAERILSLKGFAVRAESRWNEWFYENTIKGILGMKAWKKVKDVMKDSAPKVIEHINANARDTIFELIGDNGEFRTVLPPRMMEMPLTKADTFGLGEDIFIMDIQRGRCHERTVRYEERQTNPIILKVLMEDENLRKALAIDIDYRKGVLEDVETWGEETIDAWREPLRMLQGFAFSYIKEAISQLKINDPAKVKEVIRAVTNLIVTVRSAGCDDTAILAALPVIAERLENPDAFINALFIESVLFGGLVDGRSTFLRTEQYSDTTSREFEVKTVCRAVSKPVFSVYSGQFLGDKDGCLSFVNFLASKLRNKSEVIRGEKELELFLIAAAKEIISQGQAFDSKGTFERYIPQRLQEKLGSKLSDLEQLVSKWHEFRAAGELDKLQDVERQINDIVNQVNAFVSSVDEIEPAKALDVSTFKGNPDYDKYYRQAVDLIISGKYVPQFLFAGAADRMDRGSMYPLDLYELGREQGLTVPGNALEIGMGPRQVLQYRLLLSKLAKGNGRDINEVLGNSKIVIHTNETLESSDDKSIVKDFIRHNFYGFKPENVFFAVQPEFPGFIIQDGRFVSVRGSRCFPAGHGYPAMQLVKPNSFYTAASDGRKTILAQDVVSHLLAEGVDVLSVHRINDMTKWTGHVIEIDKLAYALFLSEKGHNVTAGLAENPKNQKGGQVVTRKTFPGRKLLLEKISAQTPELLPLWDRAVPCNLTRNIYRLSALPRILENGLPNYIRFRGGYFYLESVTGDLTQTPEANTEVVLESGELVHDVKTPADIPVALEYLTAQDSNPKFRELWASLQPSEGEKQAGPLGKKPAGEYAELVSIEVKDGKLGENRDMNDAAKQHGKYGKINRDMLDRVIGKLTGDKDYGPGILSVIDEIQIVDNIGLGKGLDLLPYAEIGRKDGKTILYLDVDAFSNEDVLYVEMEHEISESIMKIVPYVSENIRELTTNYLNLKFVLEKIEKGEINLDELLASLPELGVDMQFFFALKALVDSGVKSTDDEEIIAVAIEHMRGMPYYRELFKGFPFAEEWQNQTAGIEDAVKRYKKAISIFNDVREAKAMVNKATETGKLVITVRKTLMGLRAQDIGRILAEVRRSGGGLANPLDLQGGEIEKAA